MNLTVSEIVEVCPIPWPSLQWLLKIGFTYVLTVDVYTFKYKQSSLPKLIPENMSLWMQGEPSFLALKIPFHFSIGSGG